MELNFNIIYLIFYFLFVFSFLLLESENLIYSTLYLISLITTIGLFLILSGLDFIGFMLIIVYVGAIAMLFLFVLMLFNVSIVQQIKTSFSFFSYIIIFICLLGGQFLGFFFLAPLSCNYLNFNILSVNLFDIGLQLYSINSFIYVILIGLFLLVVLCGILLLLAIDEKNKE